MNKTDMLLLDLMERLQADPSVIVNLSDLISEMEIKIKTDQMGDQD